MVPRLNGGYELLLKAIRSKKREVAKDLIEKGANVNHTNHGRQCSTPLHFAILHRDIEIVELLLRRGANVNSRDNGGLTPIHNAAKDGFILEVDILLKFKAHVDSPCTSMFKNGYTPLHFAVENGKEEMMKFLISKNAIVDAKEKCGFTPLHIAVKQEYLDIVKYLIKQGACVNSSCTTQVEGYTPLHIAVHNGYEEITNLLLSEGSAVNALTKNKLTALHIAGINGHSNLVNILFENGADINAKTRDNMTPLYASVKNDSSYVVEELLKCGPDINDKINRAALGIAVKYGSGTDIEALLKFGLVVNSEDIHDSELLFKAVKHGYKKIVEHLIGFGADVNSCNEYGETLIVCAVKCKRNEIAKLLINHGCDVNVKLMLGETPLISGAVETMNLDIIKTLLLKKANVRIKNSLNYTPLHYCASTEREDVEEIAHLLIKEGAEINVCEHRGRTPLHIAAKIGRDKLVRLLLEYNANIDARDTNGVTPLCFAVENNNVEATKLLLERGADINTKDENGINILHVAITNGYDSIVELLLKYNANDINMKYENGLTLLHIATNHGIIDLLLKQGADVNARDNISRAPIFYAAQNGCEKVTRILVNEGVDVNTKDNDGLTAIHVAVENMDDYYREEEREDNLILLLECNADPNSRCNKGMTPLHIAAQNGCREAVEILLGFGADINITSDDGKTLFDYVGESGFNAGVDSSIKEHIVMLKIANLYVSEKNLQIISSDFKANYEKKYKREVKFMKRKIKNTNVSIYDILSKDKNKLAIYFKNEDIFQFLNSFDYKSKLYHYAGLIRFQIQMGIGRKSLLENVNNFFNTFRNDLIKLPQNCVDKIFCYVSDEDLRKF